MFFNAVGERDLLLRSLKHEAELFMTQADPDNEATFEAITFPSDLHSARVAADAVLREVQDANYAIDATFAIKLALEEALTNAIKHGNGNDSSRQVTLRYAVSSRKCVIIVRDQGRGFELDKVPDCTKGDRLPLPFGRGIMLMRAYMDRVVYRESGAEIYLMKRNQ